MPAHGLVPTLTHLAAAQRPNNFRAGAQTCTVPSPYPRPQISKIPTPTVRGMFGLFSCQRLFLIRFRALKRSGGASQEHSGTLSYLFSPIPPKDPRISGAALPACLGMQCPEGHGGPLLVGFAGWDWNLGLHLRTQGTRVSHKIDWFSGK